MPCAGHRTGPLLRRNVYRVLWKRLEFDDSFNHRVCAFSMDEARRCSIAEVTHALGKNAEHWMIGAISFEASLPVLNPPVEPARPSPAWTVLIMCLVSAGLVMVFAFHPDPGWRSVFARSDQASSTGAELYARVISPDQAQDETFEPAWIHGRAYPARLVDVTAPESGMLRWDPAAIGESVEAGQILGNVTSIPAADPNGLDDQPPTQDVSLDVSYGDSSIVALSSGYLVSRPWPLTHVVHKSASLFQIADYSCFRVHLAPESFPIGQAGESCEIWLRGRLLSTAEIIRAPGPSRDIGLRLSGADLSIAPGSRVDLCLLERVVRKQLYVPSEAVELQNGRAIVALVRPDMTIHFRYIEVGETGTSRIQVVKGLNVDSRIVDVFPRTSSEGASIQPE